MKKTGITFAALVAVLVAFRPADNPLKADCIMAVIYSEMATDSS